MKRTNSADSRSSSRRRHTKRTPKSDIGLVLGAGFGVALGTAFGDTAKGLLLGAGLGLVVGICFDAPANKRAREEKRRVRPSARVSTGDRMRESGIGCLMGTVVPAAGVIFLTTEWQLLTKFGATFAVALLSAVYVWALR